MSTSSNRMTMFDHVEFSVQSYEQSVKFYSACLPQLGYKLLFSDEKSKCFGFGSSDSTELLLTEGKPTSPRLHIAFKATSKTQVKEFYEHAIANGGTCNGAPGFREQYAPGYYAAFVLDPDGHNAEAVFKSPQRT